LLERQFNIDNFLDLRKEPGIDFGELMHFVEREALCERIAHIPDALRTGLTELDLDFLAISCFLIETVHTDLKAAQGFLERLLERAPNRHHLADRLHLCRQARISSSETFRKRNVAPW